MLLGVLLDVVGAELKIVISLVWNFIDIESFLISYLNIQFIDITF